MSLELENNINIDIISNNVNNNNNEYKNSQNKILTYDNNVDIDLSSNELSFDKYNTDFNLELQTLEHLSAKQYLLIIPITKFFKKARNLYVLFNLLSCKTAISLRLIEYFVVNYVLENNTFYDLKRYRSNPKYLIENLFEIKKGYDEFKPEDFIDASLEDKNDFGNASYNDLFMIHDNYKCKLKEYNKKNFDPFCRWERVTLTYEKQTQLQGDKIITIKEKTFETTVAQLNFFKWAIENHIIDYMTEHFDEINDAMLKFEEQTKLEKEQKRLLNKQLKLNNVNETLNTENNIDYSNDNIKKTKKKEIIYCNADKKTAKKQRIKKEFTKTNKSIIQYNNEKILKFK